jgi:hypothetical protein
VAIVATSYGSGGNKSAATTMTIATGVVIPAGTLLVLAVCCDNVTATTPTISSITNIGGSTWTDRAGSVTQSGATATAGAGVFVYCQTLFTATSVPAGTNVIVTFNASPTAKAMEMWGFTDMQNILRNTVASAASTAGTPSIATTGTALVAGDLVIGIAGAENNVVMTGDTDTLNGSWSTIDGVATTGGNAQTNTAVCMQYKVVNATGAQTYNPTGGAADSVAIVFAIVPANILTPVNVSEPVGITDSITWAKPAIDVTDIASMLRDTGSNSLLNITSSFETDTNADGIADGWHVPAAPEPLVVPTATSLVSAPSLGHGSKGQSITGGASGGFLISDQFIGIGKATGPVVTLLVSIYNPGAADLYAQFGYVYYNSSQVATGNYAYINNALMTAGGTSRWRVTLTLPTSGTVVFIRPFVGLNVAGTLVFDAITLGDSITPGGTPYDYYDPANRLTYVPGVGGYPKISTITDTFDTQLDGNIWPNRSNNPTWEAGRIKCGMTGTNYSGFATDYTYDATNSSVFCKMVPPPGADSRETALGLEVGPGNQDGASILVFGGPRSRSICLRRREGSTNYNSFPSGGYDPAKHVWFRIRMVGTTQFQYDYSTDGVNWVDFGVTETTALNMTACKIIMQSGQWNLETDSPQYGYFDNVNTAVPAAKIDTFNDDFATSIDLYKWTVDDGNAPVVWESGQAKLTCGISTYSWLTSLQAYDLRESSVFAKMTPPVQGRVTREFNLRLGNNDNVNRAYFIITNDPKQLAARVRINSVNSDATWIPYDPVAHQWVRIRLVGTTMYWETSPNGSTWNAYWSTTVDPSLFSSVTIGLECGQWQTEVDTGSGYVDNINVAPAGGALTANVSDSIGITDVETEAFDKAASDAVAVYDAYAGYSDRAVGAQDTNGLRDTSSNDVTIARSDSVAVTDTVATAFVRISDVADQVGVTDSVAVVKSLTVDQSDRAGVTDTIVAATVARDLSDAVGIADSIVVATVARSLTDTVGVTDVEITAVAKDFSEPVGVTDSVTTVKSAISDLSDVENLTDTVAGTAITTRDYSDPANLTDSVSTTKSAPGDFADIAGLADYISTVTAYVRNYQEPENLTDLLGKELGRPFSDPENLTDTINRGMARDYSDPMGATDTFARGYGRGLTTELVGVTDSCVATKTALGRPKVWNGSAFMSKPGKWWSGAAWIEKPWKVWTGSSWKTPS